MWALAAAATRRRAARRETTFLGGILGGGSYQNLIKLPLAVPEFPQGNK